MDGQNGETEEKEVIGEGIGESEKTMILHFNACHS